MKKVKFTQLAPKVKEEPIIVIKEEIISDELKEDIAFCDKFPANLNKPLNGDYFEDLMKEWKHSGIAVGNMVRAYDKYGSLNYPKLIKYGILKVHRDRRTKKIAPIK